MILNILPYKTAQNQPCADRRHLAELSSPARRLISGVRTTGRRVDVLTDERFGRPGCAQPEAFTRWDPEAERGWRGPNGRLETPCFGANLTNWWSTAWTETERRLARQAGRFGGDVSARGDDLVLFL